MRPEEIAPSDTGHVELLSLADESCLREVREVLKKHNALSRFGITLLHQHFPVADDEVLLETCDPETRTLTIRPTKTEQLINPIETSWYWRNDTPEVLLACDKLCDLGHHFCLEPLQVKRRNSSKSECDG